MHVVKDSHGRRKVKVITKKHANNKKGSDSHTNDSAGEKDSLRRSDSDSSDSESEREGRSRKKKKKRRKSGVTKITMRLDGSGEASTVKKEVDSSTVSDFYSTDRSTSPSVSPSVTRSRSFSPTDHHLKNSNNPKLKKWEIPNF